MANPTVKAWEIIDGNTAIIREVIDAARCVDADLSGNTDSRIRGGYMMIEEARVRRLVKAVKALDSLSLPVS